MPGGSYSVGTSQRSGAAVQQQPTKSPETIRLVNQAAETLAKHLSQNEDLLSVLVERLEFALRPNAPSPSVPANLPSGPGSNQAAEPPSALSETLLNFGCRLRTCNERLMDVLDRLQF
jgi:hypothetical protein